MERGWLPYKRGIAVDTETDGFNPDNGNRPFLTILFSDTGRSELVWADDPQAKAKIAAVLQDPGCIKTYWNAPFDIRMHKAMYDIAPVEPFYDARVAMSLLDEKAFPFKLKPCAAVYLKENTLSAGAIDEWLAHNRAPFMLKHGREPNYSDVPRDLMAKYCTDDGKYTIKFLYLLDGGIRRLGIENVMQTENNLIPCLVAMADAGVLIDEEYLKSQIAKAREFALYQKQVLTKEFGYIPNMKSPKQVCEFMYGKLGLKCEDFTDSGAPSSGKIALKRHARSSIPIKRMKRIRQLESLAGMCETIMEARMKDGLLHPTTNQAGAVTGRMSMNGPNLQNMTREGTVEGFSIRSAFKPLPGWRNFHSDYKQVEMVDFADYSQDPIMCGAIREGRDVHKATAKRVLQVLGEDRDPTAEERQLLGKTPNFAIIYGTGDKTFAATLNNDDSTSRLFTVGEASNIRRAYLSGFPGVGMLKSKVGFEIATKGCITDRFGRVHRLGSDEAYKAINWVVQGGCGLLLKRAVIRMTATQNYWNRCTGEEVVRMMYTVHDEVAFRVRADLDENFTNAIVGSMCAAMTGDRNIYDLPLKCDVEEEKPDWGHMAEYVVDFAKFWDHPAARAGDHLVHDCSKVKKWWKPEVYAA